MIPTILLDIDGVLNDDLTCRRPAVDTLRYGLIDESYLGMDPQCVERIDRIVHATSAQIILSTSWVTAIGLDVTLEHLRWNGLQAPIMGATPRDIHPNKIREITNWLYRNPDVLCGGRYVILDDDPKLHTSHRKGSVDIDWDDHLVRPDVRLGIQDGEVEAAISILTRRS